MHPSFLTLSLTLSLQVGPSLPPGPPLAPTTGGPSPLANQVLIGVTPGGDVGRIVDAAGGSLGGSFGNGVDPLSLGGPATVALVEFGSAKGLELGVAILGNQRGVLFVEPNRPASPPEACGTVHGVGPQQCTAAFFDATPTAPELIGQPALPAIGLGPSTQPAGGVATRVAVIDTGVDFLHPLFAGRFAGVGYDFVLDRPIAYDLPDGLDQDGDGDVDEGYGHGTFVAGLIVLTDPTVELLPYRVLDSDGIGTAWDVAQAIYWAVLDGADVINLSLSLSGPSQAVEEAIEFATDDDIDGLVVAAAGNTATLGVAYPAAYESVLAVAAIDAGGVVADFSGYGPEVDLAAPGVDVYSAMPGFQFATWSGTSMSTALVSGAASRLVAFTAGAEDAEGSGEALVETAVSLGATNPGLGDLLGSGAIDVASAGAAIADGD